MQALYLRSVKSPIQAQNFVFRQPARPMNRSEIYSQAVVEEEDDYMLDSFCVDSDEMEHEEDVVDDSESILLDETAVTPVRARRPPRRRAPILMTGVRTDNGRARKRIISHPDSSSDSDVATTSPAKVSALAASKQQETPTSPVISQRVGPPPTSATTTSFAMSKEERLKKQREKQEEFRRNINAARQSSSNGTVPMSDRAAVPNVSVVSTPSANTSLSVRLLISSRQMVVID